MKKNRRRPRRVRIARVCTPKRLVEEPKLLCGMAKCIDAEAIPELELGKMYFIQEIPNMLGHVVVLGRGIQIVGIHSERFEMYDGDND